MIRNSLSWDDAMLARYLGNKQAIMPELLETVGSVAPPGSHVVDAFSGSLAVSLGLKVAGFRVTANDVNLFSAVLADAYLIPSSLPPTNTRDLLGARASVRHLGEARSIVSELAGQPGFTRLTTRADWRAQYEQFIIVLLHLATIEQRDLPRADRNTLIFDNYCEAGSSSAFESSRGAVGRRRFFSPENAARIDLVLNQLRVWRRSGLTDDHTHALLLAAVMRGVEKVSNTQGTYHDFPREVWDSRALKPFRFEPPALDGIVCGVGGHGAGRERDSLEFIAEVDDHEVLYLDPPYNFRQYTAYYFLPNVLCRFPDMDDPAEYFSRVRYVRGQNPEDDFTSTFCKPKRFIDEMRTLIDRARCQTVVISYFTGRNHWGSFDSGPDDRGRELLCELLTSEPFEAESLRVVEVERLNYASYGGYKARRVSELLLVARKRQDDLCGPQARAARWLQPVA